MEESNNMKLKDYFIQAENVIENNLKIVIPSMLIYTVFSVIFILLNRWINNSIGDIKLDDPTQAVSYLLTTTLISLAMVLIFTLIKVFLLLKINTGLNFVEDKRVSGSVLKKIGRLLLADLICFCILYAIGMVIIVIIFLLLLVNQVLGALFILVISIPMCALSLVIASLMYSVFNEIIVKNTQVIESFKVAYKNVMKSKNKTLSKMLVGTCIQIIASIAITFFSTTESTMGQSYISIILVSALQAAIMVYFSVYFLIVYMSSEA